MGTNFDIEGLAESAWNLGIGFKSLFGLNITWDFTEGLTKEQYIRRWKRELGIIETYVCPNGRIIIPRFNIY